MEVQIKVLGTAKGRQEMRNVSLSGLSPTNELWLQGQ